MYQLEQVRVIREQRVILSIDELDIDPSALTVVLGHNGSGKSTLVNLLAGQISPDKGQILLGGKNISHYSSKALARKVAFLPQKLPDVAGLNVAELVRLGRYPWRGVFSRWMPEDEALIEHALEQTNITQFRDSLADELSGGERQRAWIAMLLAQQSQLLILDEPTSALDIQYQYQVMDLLKSLNQATGKGVIVILHDLNLALRYATQVVALKKGCIAFHGSAELLQNQQQLTDLYSTDIQLIDHPNQNHKVAIIC